MSGKKILDGLAQAIAHTASMYDDMAASHPSLRRGMVWCRTCYRMERVNSANALRHGWPKCCGATMTIDHPDTWSAPPPSHTEEY